MKFVTKDSKETGVQLYLKSVEDGIELTTTNGMCLMVFKDGKFKRVKFVEEEGIDTDTGGRIIEMDSW